jgi:SPX domain protein involved in polyphosphate accumulation
MDNKKIFRRYELKYLLTTEQFNIIQNIIELYMNKEKFFNSTIRNIYYDTPNYYLIRTSIEKPEYKEKIRIRSYKTVDETEEVFVELKKKYKKVVYKRREILPYNQAKRFLEQKIMPNVLQITKEIDYAIKYYNDLRPTLFLSYQRTAYIGKEDLNFRITFDKNIIWRTYDIDLTKEVEGEYLLAPDMILMEVKTLMGLPRWLLDFLGENKIYKQSFSKYGNAYKKILENKENMEEIKYA